MQSSVPIFFKRRTQHPLLKWSEDVAGKVSEYAKILIKILGLYFPVIVVVVSVLFRWVHMTK